MSSAVGEQTTAHRRILAGPGGFLYLRSKGCEQHYIWFTNILHTYHLKILSYFVESIDSIPICTLRLAGSSNLVS